MIYFNHKIQKFICLLLWLLPPLAGFSQKMSFKTAHQKAYNFSTVNQDSALFYAKKMPRLAKENTQRYQAYYILGYCASNMHYNKLSRGSYRQAMRFAKTSEQKHKSYNSYAWRLYDMGEPEKAQPIVDTCLAFFHKNNLPEGLSYAYDLKANILINRKDEACFGYLKQSAQLKKGNDKGFAYQALAKAFFAFGKLDSAIYYQQTALKIFPLKSPDKVAENSLLLAKYQLFAGDFPQAQSYIEHAETLKKTKTTRLLWRNVRALYYLKTKAKEEANSELAKFDEVFDILLEDKASKNTVYQKVKENYTDILRCELSPAMRKHYKEKLKTANAYLEGYNAAIKTEDEKHFREVFGTPLSNKTNTLQILFTIIALVALLIFGIYKKNKTNTPPPNPEEKTENTTDKELLKAVEAVINKKLETRNEQDIIKKLYEGESYAKIARYLDLNENTIKSTMNRLAKQVSYPSMLAIINEYKAKQEASNKKDDSI